MAPSRTNTWPLAVTAAFALVLAASFLPWGTIRYHYTEQFMAYMNHPGLYNSIVPQEDLSGLKLGAKMDQVQTGSAWRTGFVILGLYVPHWLLTIVALLLFICAIADYFDLFSINPPVPQLFSFFGLIHVTESALGFFSQGSIEWGLILTGAGFLIFTISYLRW